MQPALNASFAITSKVSSASRGWVRVRKGCEAQDIPAQHLVRAKNITTDILGSRDSAPSPGLEPAGALRPHPQPRTHRTLSGGPGYPRLRLVGLTVVPARCGDKEVRGPPALKVATDSMESRRRERQGAPPSPHSHPLPCGGARGPAPHSWKAGRRGSAHTACRLRGVTLWGGGCPLLSH